MDVLHSLNIGTWKGPYSEADRREAIEALESGAVLYFPPPSLRACARKNSVC